MNKSSLEWLDSTWRQNPVTCSFLSVSDSSWTVARKMTSNSWENCSTFRLMSDGQFEPSFDRKWKENIFGRIFVLLEFRATRFGFSLGEVFLVFLVDLFSVHRNDSDLNRRQRRYFVLEARATFCPISDWHFAVRRHFFKSQEESFFFCRKKLSFESNRTEKLKELVDWDRNPSRNLVQPAVSPFEVLRFLPTKLESKNRTEHFFFFSIRNSSNFSRQRLIIVEQNLIFPLDKTVIFNTFSR